MSELTTLYQNDNNFFDTYVIKKGYTFLRTTGESTEKMDLLYSIDNNPVYNTISVKYISDDSTVKERCIQWTFKSDTEYLNFKDELSQTGYKFYAEKTLENGRQYRFKNENYIVMLMTVKPLLWIGMVHVALIRSLR